MNQALRETLTKGVFTVLRRVGSGGPIDPIDVTERVMDTVELLLDMQSEEAGIGSVPADLMAREQVPQKQAAWDIRQNAAAEPEDNRPHFLTPPPTNRSVTPVGAIGAKPKSVLVMPGDPEFTAPAELTAKPGAAKASLSRRHPVARSASSAPAKQYWTEIDMINTITDNTPAEIPFEIQRSDGTPFKIKAARNIVNRQGLGSVVLTYRDLRISDTGSDRGSFPLMAQVSFSLYDEDIDIEKAMSSIVEQLVGLYRDRSSGMPQPVAIGPEPNLGDYMRTGMPAGSVDITIDRDAAGRAIHIPGTTHTEYQERSKDDILQGVLNSIRRGNASSVPAESRLK